MKGAEMLPKRVIEALGSLNDRERACLEAYADGMTKAEIGAELFITENTVKTHLKSACLKLEARNTTQAAVWVALHATVGAIVGNGVTPDAQRGTVKRWPNGVVA